MIRAIILIAFILTLILSQRDRERLHAVEIAQLEIIKKQQVDIKALCEVTAWQENLLQTNVAKLAIRWSRDTSDICR